ncbi:MAG: ATPase, FliI/YscN family [Hyphomicrobiales bacterium]|nr:ATPase, FliI/YscN family [Hyphomicrobiales bacterium]
MTDERINALADRLDACLASDNLVQITGHVTEVTPSSFRVAGLTPFLRLGDRLEILEDDDGMGEIVRIDPAGAVVKPFANRIEVGIGARARVAGRLTLSPDPSWRGRIIDALGKPIDGLGVLRNGEMPVPIEAEPPAAMTRGRVTQRVSTGIRAIDVFTPLCAGQRIGVFAGSGVGKSTLLSMFARSRGFDTVVVALVGERGRELREFVEESLGEARQNAVTIAATSDESPMRRRLAPRTAMAVAEYFRDLGHSVLLIVDSVTRFAHAARDVALAAGEPAVARGYPPSVFTDLPKLLERAGPGAEGSGSITGIFSVLVDGDDHNDPVADAIRGTLDGHVVLSRAIADQGRYPAIDILGSISRLSHHVWSPEQRALVMRLRALTARYEDTRDLRLMGGYQPGNDAELDQAMSAVPKLYNALMQLPHAPSSEDGFRDLAEALRAQ